VNEGNKYPISGKGENAILNMRNCCFGKDHEEDIQISGKSNLKNKSYCYANRPTYRLPPAKGKGCEEGSSSINGGKVYFTSKNFEVYKVFVRKLSFLIFFRKNEVASLSRDVNFCE
jgi:hypothetical protein